jgi:predicted RNase H-like nuclease (RuvC/YqgF family)
VSFATFLSLPFSFRLKHLFSFQEGDRRWPWPYVVMSRLEGIPLRDLLEKEKEEEEEDEDEENEEKEAKTDVEGKQENERANATEETIDKEFTNDEHEQLARCLGRLLRKLHDLPLPAEVIYTC